MTGLIDSSGGINFGTGLQFEAKIGNAGLTIITTPPVPENVLCSDGSNFLCSDGSQMQTPS